MSRRNFSEGGHPALRPDGRVQTPPLATPGPTPPPPGRACAGFPLAGLELQFRITGLTPATCFHIGVAKVRDLRNYGCHMAGYPLGNFPRFGHQERWAAERRTRAIANSIATRQHRKVLRQKDEFRRVQTLLAVWSWLDDQINRKPAAPEIAKLAQSTASKIYRLTDTWNAERHYGKQLDAIVSATYQIAADFGLTSELERCIPVAAEHVRKEFHGL